MLGVLGLLQSLSQSPLYDARISKKPNLKRIDQMNSQPITLTRNAKDPTWFSFPVYRLVDTDRLSLSQCPMYDAPIRSQI